MGSDSKKRDNGLAPAVGCIIIFVVLPIGFFAMQGGRLWVGLSYLFAFITAVAAYMLVYRRAARHTSTGRAFFLACVVFIVAAYCSWLFFVYVANPHRDWVDCMRRAPVDGVSGFSSHTDSCDRNPGSFDRPKGPASGLP